MHCADSVEYLPTTIATVFTFLTPVLGPWLALLFLRDPFPWYERFAGAASLLGVLIIALPFGDSVEEPVASAPNHPARSGTIAGSGNSTCALSPGPSCPAPWPSSPRKLAMAIAVLGVLGASVAYTFIRKIGNQAHSLIIVNYLSDMSTLFSLIVLVFGRGIQAPSSLVQACYLMGLGVCGFAGQWFLTMGLQEDKTNAAAIMIYTQLLFAMAFDWILWGTVPTWSSWVGSGVIFGSAAFVAVRKARTDFGAPASQIDKDNDEEQQGLVGVTDPGDSDEVGRISDISRPEAPI